MVFAELVDQKTQLFFSNFRNLFRCNESIYIIEVMIISLQFCGKSIFYHVTFIVIFRGNDSRLSAS